MVGQFSLPVVIDDIDLVMRSVKGMMFMINVCTFTATKLQANWKGYCQKSKYQKMRRSGMALKQKEL